MNPNPYQPGGGSETGGNFQPQQPKRKRHTGRNVLIGVGVLTAFVVGSALAVAGSGPTPTPSGTVAAPPATTWSSQFNTDTAAPPAPVAPITPDTTTEAAPEFPPQVAQARDSAQSYLQFKGFSRDGLISQLSSNYADDYPKDVATQAVDSLTVDWNEQATKSAQDYLNLKSFSCSGLISQLSSSYADHFTKAQATYGAHQTTACK